MKVRRLRRGPALLAVGALACVGAAVLVGLSARLFVWPATGPPERADALVVLGPGRVGERFEAALGLLRRHLAARVVVSESKRPRRWPLERVLCARPHAICFRATPFTTRGEARAVARIASRHGWRRLLVVTSSYHVTRARLLYSRCFRGRVQVVAARRRGGPESEIRAILHEWGGLVDALLFARSC